MFPLLAELFAEPGTLVLYGLLAVVGVLAWAEIFELAREASGFDVAFERALLAAGASVLVAAVLAMIRRGG